MMLVVGLITLVCKPQSGVRKEQSSNIQTQQVAPKPRISVHCTYSPYNTAMGKGKGILFAIELLKDTVGVEIPKVDSLVIGGINLPFVVKSNDPFILEANYLKHVTEPSVENPNPSQKKDPIADDKAFEPAWLILSQQGTTYRLPIDYIYLKQY